MPLGTKTEGLETLEKQERAEGVETSAKVSQDLAPDLDRERDRPECLAELEAVVPLRGLCELRELPRADPVELPYDVVQGNRRGGGEQVEVEVEQEVDEEGGCDRRQAQE